MAIKLMGSITSCAPLMIFLHFDVKLERESNMNEGIKYTNIYFMSLLNVDFILENNGMAWWLACDLFTILRLVMYLA